MPPIAIIATSHAGALNRSNKIIEGINDPAIARMFNDNVMKYGTLFDVPHDGQSIEINKPSSEGIRSNADGRIDFEQF